MGIIHISKLIESSSGRRNFNYSKIFLLVCRTKKLFEFPVKMDFAKEKAFIAAKYPLFFQIFLRIRFFDIEVRFFGTAIQKSYLFLLLYVKDMYCSKWMVIFSYFLYLILSIINSFL